MPYPEWREKGVRCSGKWLIIMVKYRKGCSLCRQIGCCIIFIFIMVNIYVISFTNVNYSWCRTIGCVRIKGLCVLRSVASSWSVGRRVRAMARLTVPVKRMLARCSFLQSPLCRRRDGRRLLGESVSVHHSLGVLGGEVLGRNVGKECWEGGVRGGRKGGKRENEGGRGREKEKEGGENGINDKEKGGKGVREHSGESGEGGLFLIGGSVVVWCVACVHCRVMKGLRWNPPNLY